MSRQRFSAAALVVALTTIALSGTLHAGGAPKPVRALLVIGGGYHDYAKQKDILAQGIAARAHVEVTVAYDPDKGTKNLNPVFNTPDWAKNYDVVIHDECSADVKDVDLINRILEPHRQGLPAVLLHCTMHSYRSAGFPQNTPWFEFTGLLTDRHGPQVPIAVTHTDKQHPISKGLEDWTTINEELYNNLTGKLMEGAHALARGKQVYKDKSGKEVTADAIVTWTNLYRGKTKVFATTLGHNNATVADPRYLDLVTRGLLWSVGKLDETHLKPAKK